MNTRDDIVYRSAEGYNLQQGIPEEIGTKEDVLVIDQKSERDWISSWHAAAIPSMEMMYSALSV